MKKIDVIASTKYDAEVIERVSRMLEERNRERPFHFFLSGGSTPKVLYAGLAGRNLDWDGIHLWWGDERFVPPDHADSNYRMVKEQLLDKIHISPLQVHPWPILSSPAISADTYDREFRSFFVSGEHSLDLQLLGMGDDGHTASLFPGSPGLSEEERMCVANPVEGKESVRLSLTFPALALSRHVVFLVKGKGKADAAKQVLEDEIHPASRVEGRESTEFWLDSEAAAKLHSHK